jgi:hypothetical protein
LLFGIATASFALDDAKAKKKPSPARLKGMKSAIADIEKGVLMQLHQPLPDPPWYQDYVATLKRDYGIAGEVPDGEWTKEQRDEVEGYNDVMRVEIEHRFGRGILEKVMKAARDEIEKKPGEKNSAEK